MHKGVITHDYKMRFVDKIARVMYKMKLFKTDGYYPITDIYTGKEIAAFVCIYGSRFIVNFLEVVTQYRGKNLKNVDIEY